MSHTPVQEFTDYVDYTACEKDFAKTVSEYAEPVALYRKILSAQPDKSVTFVSLGFGTTLAQLLESAPDEYPSEPANPENVLFSQAYIQKTGYTGNAEGVRTVAYGHLAESVRDR